MFICMLQSFYLTFEAINISSQKPCILRADFTHAYWMLDSLSCPLLSTLDITQDGSSFQHLNTSTSTYATPTFIAKELCFITYVQQF